MGLQLLDEREDRVCLSPGDPQVLGLKVLPAEGSSEKAAVGHPQPLDSWLPKPSPLHSWVPDLVLCVCVWYLCGGEDRRVGVATTLGGSRGE